MPNAIYLGRLPDVDGLKILEIQRRLTAIPAGSEPEIDGYKPQSYGPIFDLEADVNYVVLDAGNEHELSIPFLLEKGWSEELLPDWLLGLISKPWRDPNPRPVDM